MCIERNHQVLFWLGWDRKLSCQSLPHPPLPVLTREVGLVHHALTCAVTDGPINGLAFIRSCGLLPGWCRRDIGLSASARCPGAGDLRPQCGRESVRVTGGAKLNIRGIRRPFGRPHTVDSAERRRILREEDVRGTRLYGQRPHVLRRSENGPGITARARRS